MQNILISTAGIIGTDNVVPMLDVNGLWHMWALNEIYTGSVGANKHVPLPQDYVIDPANFTTWIVDAIDPVTLIPVLREIRPANMSYSFTATDVLLGVGAGTPSELYRAYLDTSVTPYVLSVDTSLTVKGTQCSYAKIFKGVDLTATGHVISRIYNNSGAFVSNNVPLELVAFENTTNYAVKSVAVCNAIEQLIDNEVVTIVFYSAVGGVVSKRQLLIENTPFMRTLNAQPKQITHIAMDSPFLSATSTNTLEVPINTPLTALNITGVISYTDGTTSRIPVDNTRLTVMGIEQYTPAIPSQPFTLALKYTLQTGESASTGLSLDGTSISVPYTLSTLAQNNAYGVKLFGYPSYVSAALGYTMIWSLFNLDRNIYYDVTNLVQFTASTGAFDPKAYGILQRKTVQINLRDVSGAFANYIHSQTVDIVLQSAPVNRLTAWQVLTQYAPNRNQYGNNLHCVLANASTNTINISSNILTQTDWVQRMYLDTYPLINPTTETTPLLPTHFQVIQNGNINDYPIADWSVDFNLSYPVAIGSTVLIKFVLRTGVADIQLSIAGLTVVQ